MHLSVAAERTGRAGRAVLDAFAHDRAQHLHRRRRARQSEAPKNLGVLLDEFLRGEDRERGELRTGAWEVIGGMVQQLGHWMGV